MGTGATMLIRNQCQAAVGTSISDTECMFENGDDRSHLEVFNSLSIAPYTTSESVYIEAKGSGIPCAFKQSSFVIGIAGQDISNNFTMGIDLGTGPSFQTAITSNSNPSQFNAVLAPNRPVSSGVSYSFFFYAGPGIVQAYANSVIQANLSALVKAALLGQVIKIGVVSLQFSTLTGLDSILCTYSAVTPAANGAAFTLKLESGNLGVNGAVAAGSFVGTTFDISTRALSIVVEGTLSFADAKPAMSLSLLKISLQDYSISGSILDLTFLGPIVQLIKIFATGPDLAGIVNDNYNIEILTAINKYLQTL